MILVDNDTPLTESLEAKYETPFNHDAFFVFEKRNGFDISFLLIFVYADAISQDKKWIMNADTPLSYGEGCGAKYIRDLQALLHWHNDHGFKVATDSKTDSVFMMYREAENGRPVAGL